MDKLNTLDEDDEDGDDGIGDVRIPISILIPVITTTIILRIRITFGDENQVIGDEFDANN